jgi:hypothetical protein
MYVNAASTPPSRRGVGILFVVALSLAALGWAVHPHEYGPHSVTIVGISEPGSGAGIYNGLRAKSVPVITHVSRLEQDEPAAPLFSFTQADVVQ